jgi:hypothetical protein
MPSFVSALRIVKTIGKIVILAWPRCTPQLNNKTVVDFKIGENSIGSNIFCILTIIYAIMMAMFKLCLI